MKLFVLSAVAVTLTMTAPVLAVDSSSVSTKDSQKLTDLSKTLTVAPGQKTVTLRLPANRTTGYQWFLVSVNRHLLIPESNTYEAPNSKLVGSPGVSVWKFKVNDENVTVPMVTAIRMTYSRPWFVTPAD
ncbi:MAG: hypothetical protein A3F17_03830, partial [Gammaproteobacteria bacterium RIFCSPHIGHO2_12_FULL_41_15]